LALIGDRDPNQSPNQSRDYDDDADDVDCSWCLGEGEQDQCDDPLGCPGPHDRFGGGCPCRACDGTGLRSRQTVF
jgi:hypothetical protein